MRPFKVVFRTSQQEKVLGPGPGVIGVLSSLAWQLPPSRPEGSCDFIEVRLDKTGRPDGWLDRCREIENRGWPVLLTIRLKSEGGEWHTGDARRLPLFEDAIEQLAAVDIEWRSQIVHRVAMLCKRRRKVAVISYHDFKGTPPREALAGFILEAQQIGSVIKIATKLNSPADEETLRSVLAQEWRRPLCVIGMGPKWAHTRVAFPKLGSCLAYGYLDKPSAPGQMSVAELIEKLKDAKVAL
jgi:3-dehydroquinate dehydratase-1